MMLIIIHDYYTKNYNINEINSNFRSNNFNQEQNSNRINKQLPELNQMYSCRPDQRSINVRPNIVDFDSRKRNPNQIENNYMNNIQNENNNMYNNDYNLIPDPDNFNQMDYLKNLLEKTKNEIDNLNNNIDEDTSKTFSIYK